MITVLLADDHSMVRDGLRYILEAVVQAVRNLHVGQRDFGLQVAKYA